MAANALVTAAPYIAQAVGAAGQYFMNSNAASSSASQSYGVNEALMRQQYLYNTISSLLAEQQYYRTGEFNFQNNLKSMQHQADINRGLMYNNYQLNLDYMNRSNL